MAESSTNLTTSQVLEREYIAVAPTSHLRESLRLALARNDKEYGAAIAREILRRESGDAKAEESHV